jgi:hypothetical protein
MAHQTDASCRAERLAVAVKEVPHWLAMHSISANPKPACLHRQNDHRVLSFLPSPAFKRLPGLEWPRKGNLLPRSFYGGIQQGRWSRCGRRALGSLIHHPSMVRWTSVPRACGARSGSRQLRSYAHRALLPATLKNGRTMTTRPTGKIYLGGTYSSSVSKVGQTLTVLSTTIRSLGRVDRAC